MKEKELVKLRKKVYQLLKVNDATNKVSWWNLSDDVVDLIESERERVIGEIRKELELTVEDNEKGVGEWTDGIRCCAEGMLDFINKLKKK